MTPGATLGIIPARGGSKGIKDKNIVDLSGRPLIAYTIQAAQQSGVLDDIILSTDSEAIAEVAASYGVHTQGLRPPHLATDTAVTADVVRHEIEIYEKTRGPIGTIVLLQPTAPLRRATDIAKGLVAYRQSGAASLISCYDAEGVHPRIMYTANNGVLTPLLEAGRTLVRRQEMEKIYIRNGALYVTDRDYFMKENKLVSEAPALYEMPAAISINIDAPGDLDHAAYLLSRQS